LVNTCVLLLREQRWLILYKMVERRHAVRSDGIVNIDTIGNITMKHPLVSVIDFVSLRLNESPTDAITRATNFAKEVERLGYFRYWIPEHHAAPSLASACPAILISRIAEATRSIRVGAGGVMLLNHSPMVVAEQFGTLEWMFPGRIDLGLGRAVGTSKVLEEATKKALRRDSTIAGDDFPELVKELMHYLGPKQQDQLVEVSPGQDTNVPIFLLSSSGYSAQLAGEMGLPFAFAAHISSANLMSSVSLYREHFRPSKVLDRPYVMVATVACAAESDRDAQRCMTTFIQFEINVRRNQSAKLRPPVENLNEIVNDEERQTIDRRLQRAIVGGRETVRRSLQSLIEETGADELFFFSQIYDDADRFLSYSILAEAAASL
jgi:luciferase family oxidoreductase group 1